MASLDVKRPAAQEQLAVLGRAGRRRHAADRRRPDIRSQIARRAEQAAKLQGYDVVLLDTAGRTHIDEPLMAEMAEIKARLAPARNPARRRCADRPGRRQSRQEL